MTRINTNVSSLIAQKTLARSNTQLQESLLRLSTGLRINTGKDDPSGLIAAEVLKSDILSVGRAITNNERANQLIATADSALGQVTSLVNDIRGLVTEAANGGVQSSEQIAALQLQIDSSLEAVDRIARTTSFQGRRLLDGSLDFLTSGVDSAKLTDVKISQANFGTQSAIGVQVDVVKQATQGSLNYKFGAISGDVSLEVGGRGGFEVFNFDDGSTIESIAAAVNLVSDATGVTAEVETAATKGELTVSSFGGDNDIVITADAAGFDEGDLRVKYSKGNTSATTATYTAASGGNPATISVALKTTAATAAVYKVDQAGNDNDFTITAVNKGTDYNGVTVAITLGGTAGAETITYNETTKTLTIDAHATSTVNQIVAAFSAAANEKAGELFTAAKVEGTGGGTGTVAASANAATQTTTAVNGGAIAATADDVVAAINSAAGSVVTAAVAAGSDGTGVASVFQEFAYYGEAAANNRLQFLAPENASKIRFTSVAGQSLGVDTTTSPRVTTFSSVVHQHASANGSLKFTAKQKGTEYDGYTIEIKDNANVTAGNEFSVLDRDNKKITIHIDSGNTTAAQVVTAVNGNSLVSSVFEAANFGSSTGAAAITAGSPITLTTAGALVDEGTLIVKLATNADGIVTTTANDLISFFNDSANAATLSPFGVSVTNAQGSSGAGKLAATTSDLAFATSGTELEDAQAEVTTFAVNGTNARIKFTAVSAGAAFDGVSVVFENDDTVTAGTDERAEYNAVTKTLKFYIDAGNTTAQHIEDIFNSADANYDAAIAALFSADAQGTGAGVVTVTDTGKTTGGVVDNGTEDGAALLGNADLANTGLTFRATGYGSENFVSVKALTGSFAVQNAGGTTATRANGTDLEARINGIKAVGKGLAASINTAALDLTINVASSLTDGASTSFSITGGGAQFQLGPDVISNQQARLGITSISTATLGGVAGKLYELRSGGAKALANNPGAAAQVIDEVIEQITSLRGRLGAFQRTTLETNIASLSDTLENLTEAESSIRDADFAAESARLTRAQILVQAGTSVLAIANSNPQNVLGLLR